MTAGVVFAQTPPSPLARSPVLVPLLLLVPLLVVVVVVLQLLLLLSSLLLFRLLPLFFLLHFHSLLSCVELKTMMVRHLLSRQEGCGQTSRAIGSRMGHRLLPAAHVAPAAAAAAHLLLLLLWELHPPPPNGAASC